MHKVIHTYTHPGGQVGVMVEASCETDFAGRTEVFGTFVHDVALQVAAMSPASVSELMKQEFVKDGSRTITGLLEALRAELKEEVHIERFVRWYTVEETKV
jgi:elongation factor Ts